MVFFSDIFEDLVSPVVAAQVFLAESCQKRKNILDPVMVYCVHILNEPPDKRDPRKKDGALNVIGTTSDVLMRVRIICPLFKYLSILVIHSSIQHIFIHPSISFYLSISL